MTARYHEHYAELLSMPWKAFCVKWCRLIIWSAQERRREAEERREREWARLRNEHAGRG